eukprot:CAMPEP_0113942830 /NCGR_PEP_ID=MMETSP1339-20121228/10528_1 /TAXON_ID=94617 /ORGANISM="Fibrocapsa japonica" /LENGTH=274 /DNA_ID=CAMNT_0000947465 /DNA_START=221 /DNA_END=1045 /DNA_ORIENTATION=+ /assembly_acc=CAM_ASM_000762
MKMSNDWNVEKFNPVFGNDDKISFESGKSLVAIGAAVAPLVAFSQEAAAKGGQYGIIEGRTVSLLHPILMGLIFVASFYSGYTGLQWRSIRTIGDEISELKTQLPTLADGSKASGDLDSKISAIQNQLTTEEDAAVIATLKSDVSALTAAKAIDPSIQELTQKRKDLLAGDFRNKHYQMSAAILGWGVTTSIGGCFNTFARTSKLFPGPHLYAGAAITVMWAISASLVPAMQKGEDWARSTHIALNTTIVALFAWQINTGWGIVQKVIEFTKFP